MGDTASFDGQIAQFLGSPTCVRRSIIPLPLPVTNAAFDAPNPDLWMAEMAKHEPRALTFPEFLLALYQKESDSAKWPISGLATRVVLESSQSLASGGV